MKMYWTILHFKGFVLTQNLRCYLRMYFRRCGKIMAPVNLNEISRKDHKCRLTDNNEWFFNHERNHGIDFLTFLPLKSGDWLIYYMLIFFGFLSCGFTKWLLCFGSMFGFIFVLFTPNREISVFKHFGL